MSEKTARTIPMAAPAAQYEALRAEIDAAVGRVLASGVYIGGEAVRSFERAFAAYCGVRHACGVASGTDALYLALRALGIGPGDEVVTTPFSFVATATAITRTGARVVFADVDGATLNLDPDAAAAAVTSRTRAILVVHLFGLPAAMDRFAALAERRGLALVEDAAQAHGARFDGRPAGSLGRLGCFSFYPTKNLGAAGDAGLVLGDDEKAIETVRRLAHHGERARYEHETIGVNSRLDAVQAAILAVKLGRLDAWNERRRALAARYRARLEGVGDLGLPVEPPGRRSVYHQFTVRTRRREALRAHLARRGIATAVHYPRPLHLQPAYRDLGLGEGAFPEAERAAAEVLSLPLYPELADEDVDAVADAVRAFFAGVEAGSG